MPDLAQLRTFAAVAQRLSFTRAAEAQGVTQQSVSRTVRALEDDLGAVLLERSTREVRLTPAGAVLLEEARELLARADAAFDRVRAVGDGSAVTVRVGITPAIGARDRADVLAALRRETPDVGVAFRDVRPAELAALLREGAIDLALARARGLDEPALGAAPLRPTPAVVCAPVSRGDGFARVSDLDGARLLVPSPAGTPYTDMVVSLLADRGARVTAVESRVTGGPELLADLASHDAVALMPAGTVAPEGVACVALPDAPALPLFVLWAAGRASPAAARLRAELGADHAAPATRRVRT